jgi:hypothetical protein
MRSASLPRVAASIVAAMSWVLGTTAAAQRPAPTSTAAPSPTRRPGSIVIRVSDKTANQPLLRVIVLNVHAGPVASQNLTDEAYADTTGVVELPDVPAAMAQHIAIMCETNTPRPRLLDTATVVLKSGERREIALKASPDGCDQRPFEVRRELFIGVWEQSKTMSKFLPCDSLLPDSWVEFRPGALDAPAAVWPADLHRDQAVFVKWDAVLVGPWHYGEGGAFEYQMTVQNVFELRAAAERDCSGVPSPAQMFIDDRSAHRR